LDERGKVFRPFTSLTRVARRDIAYIDRPADKKARFWFRIWLRRRVMKSKIMTAKKPDYLPDNPLSLLTSSRQHKFL
jgi:hypothetical protein